VLHNVGKDPQLGEHSQTGQENSNETDYSKSLRSQEQARQHHRCNGSQQLCCHITGDAPRTSTDGKATPSGPHCTLQEFERMRLTLVYYGKVTHGYK